MPLSRRCYKWCPSDCTTQIAQMTQVPWPPTHSKPRADRKHRPNARCIPQSLSEDLEKAQAQLASISVLSLDVLHQGLVVLHRLAAVCSRPRVIGSLVFRRGRLEARAVLSHQCRLCECTIYIVSLASAALCNSQQMPLVERRCRRSRPSAWVLRPLKETSLMLLHHGRNNYATRRLWDKQATFGSKLTSPP